MDAVPDFAFVANRNAAINAYLVIHFENGYNAESRFLTTKSCGDILVQYHYIR